MNINLILNTDSYKASHYLQYPEGTTGVFSYIESRGGEYSHTLFFGLQYFLKEYLTKPITKANIKEAKEFWNLHGEPFNEKGWEHILEVHGGYLPLLIKAVPEGTVVPVLNVLVTVENTCPDCYWVTSYVETSLLRAVWYPTTVATNSLYCKKVIKKYLDKTSDNPEGKIMFKLHDFGSRGVSSCESSGIGGAAHLVNFMGSDTVMGVLLANKYYEEKMSGFSIPAAEHSTITVYGQDKEVEAFRKMLELFAKPNSLVAIVSDSYDIYNAVEKLWGKELRQEVIDSGATVIIRPDSGNPPEVVLKVVRTLGEKFGYDINKKGYKVLKYVRVIQGDGINSESINKILHTLTQDEWSADNLAFGMGGALLQQLNRDTLKFAMKCSAMKLKSGEWVDVWKKPITDSGKDSKRGRLALYKNTKGEFFTDIEKLENNLISNKNLLIPVYRNGVLLNLITFENVRKNVDLNIKIRYFKMR